MRSLQSEYQALERQYLENKQIGEDNYEAYNQAQKEILRLQSQIKGLQNTVSEYSEQIRSYTIRIEETKKSQTVLV